MQQRYFSVAEVNRLLEAYLECGLGERPVSAVLDEAGIKLAN
jgi:hypothetical protein